MIVAKNWKDYEIIATGDGEKLERWKDVYLLRPDPQIIWDNGDLLNKYREFKTNDFPIVIVWLSSLAEDYNKTISEIVKGIRS